MPKAEVAAGNGDSSPYEKGLRLSKQGNHSAALKAFSGAIALDPRRAEAYFERAACHYRLGNYRQSAADLDAGALLGSERAQFWSRFASYPVPPEQERD